MAAARDRAATTPKKEGGRGALAGVRVLEVAELVAGPYCGKLLAALGAEVIKVEPPLFGDPSRRLGPFPGDVRHIERSGQFLYLNTGKKSITLSLEDGEARAILAELSKSADVLLHDCQPARARSLGLDLDTLAPLNSKLVVTALTPYGSSGPQAEWRAYDLNVFHSGGEGYLLPNGLALDAFPERAPIAAGGRMGSYQAGITAAAGSLAALYALDGSGLGQAVDCSMQDAQLALGYIPIQRLEAEGMVEDRFSRFFRVGGTLPAKDGHVELLTMEPRQWEGLGDFMGRPPWHTPEKFKDPETYGSEVNRYLKEWSRQRTKEEIYHEGQAKGVPVAPYYSPSEVFNNRHQRERGFFVPVDHPEAGRFDYAGLPFHLSETSEVMARAPLLGEHNVEVYADLGWSPQGLVALFRAGVI